MFSVNNYLHANFIWLISLLSFEFVLWCTSSMIFRPHRLHAAGDAAYCYRCRTYRGLCVCVLGTQVRCAKTAGPIETPFGELIHVGSRDHCITRSPDPPWKWHILGRTCPGPLWSTYARTRWMHSLPRGACGKTRWRCGLLPNYFGHWFGLIFH